MKKMTVHHGASVAIARNWVAVLWAAYSGLFVLGLYAAAYLYNAS